MSEAFVSLEVAKALKDAGYPQAQRPQMVWWRWQHPWRETDTLFSCDYETGESVSAEWYAAPTPLQALEWLEREKGYRYGRYYQGDIGLWYSGDVETEHGGRLTSRTPNDLILAIIKHLREAR